MRMRMPGDGRRHADEMRRLADPDEARTMRAAVRLTDAERARMIKAMQTENARRAVAREPLLQTQSDLLRAALAEWCVAVETRAVCASVIAEANAGKTAMYRPDKEGK